MSQTVLFQTIQFSISKQFKFKYILIVKSSTVSMSQTVLFQTIQFSISKQFKFKYILIVKSIATLSYSV